MMNHPKNTPYLLLKELVEAMDDAYWSSWQTTADFQDQWDAAREFLEETKG
jgi:hypothetical protein